MNPGNAGWPGCPEKYRVEEVSLAKGVTSRFPANGKVFTGAELMEKVWRIH